MHHQLLRLSFLQDQFLRPPFFDSCPCLRPPFFDSCPCLRPPFFGLCPCLRPPFFGLCPCLRPPFFGCAVTPPPPHQYILRVPPPPPPGLGTADGGGSWRRRACGAYIHVVFNGRCIRTLPNWRLVAGGGNRQVKLRAGSNVLIVNKIQPVHPC